MGKNYLSILTLLLAFGLNISAQTKTSSPALTKENANKIIGMTNCVIDIYNDQISEVRDVADCLQRFDNSINKVAENPNAAAHGASCANIRDLRSDLVSQLQKKATLAPSFPEKKAILEGIEQLNTEFGIAKERCKVIQAYLTSKKYLEDDKNFSNYTALRSSFVESYDKINDQFDKTMDLATAAGDRAELVILKSHPLASVVIPMKTSLSAVSQIMSKCRAEKPDVEVIKAEVVAVRKSIEKDKVITPTQKTALAKASNGDAVFNRFYESAAGALDQFDAYIEYLDPNKEISVDTVLKETKEDALKRHLKRQYGEIQKYYGYMVDAYNTL